TVTGQRSARPDATGSRDARTIMWLHDQPQPIIAGLGSEAAQRLPPCELRGTQQHTNVIVAPRQSVGAANQESAALRVTCQTCQKTGWKWSEKTVKYREQLYREGPDKPT